MFPLIILNISAIVEKPLGKMYNNPMKILTYLIRQRKYTVARDAINDTIVPDTLANVDAVIWGWPSSQPIQTVMVHVGRWIDEIS